MSPLWIVAAAVLVAGTIAVGRLAVRCAEQARLTEVALAEATEALIVIGNDQTDLGSVVKHLGGTADAIAGPVKASRTSVNIARSWWRRARTL